MTKNGVLIQLDREYDQLQEEIDPLLAIENPTAEQMAQIAELDHRLDIVIEQIVALEDGESGEDVGQWFIIPTKRFNF